MKSRTTRKLATLATATAALMLAPGSANAGALVTTAEKCAAQSLSQVFLPWGDPANYTLHPGGDFEPGSPAWDGATTAAGNEPWHVADDGDGRSLAMAQGSTVTSPSICVGIEHPTIRFFTKASSTLATLKVEVLFLDGAGTEQSLQIGVVTGNSDWAPTVQTPIVANLLPLLPDSRTPVAFRLTALSGNWKVDDFYVDPYAKR